MKLNPSRATSLERFIACFNQAYRTEENLLFFNELDSPQKEQRISFYVLGQMYLGGAFHSLKMDSSLEETLCLISFFNLIREVKKLFQCIDI
jgi:hypothetical protein